MIEFHQEKLNLALREVEKHFTLGTVIPAILLSEVRERMLAINDTLVSQGESEKFPVTRDLVPLQFADSLIEDAEELYGLQYYLTQAYLRIDHWHAEQTRTGQDLSATLREEQHEIDKILHRIRELLGAEAVKELPHH